MHIWAALFGIFNSSFEILDYYILLFDLLERWSVKAVLNDIQEEKKCD
jgi:hypothetical protein